MPFKRHMLSCTFARRGTHLTTVQVSLTVPARPGFQQSSALLLPFTIRKTAQHPENEEESMTLSTEHQRPR